MAMVKGIGVDLVKVARITRILEGPRKDRFLRRVLHENEAATVRKMGDFRKMLEFVAGSWAAKEAVYKSLDSQQQRQFQFHQWYRYLEGGKPQIAHELTKGNNQFLLSISHDDGHLVAMVLRMEIG